VPVSQVHVVDAFIYLSEVHIGHHHQTFVKALCDEGASRQQVAIARRNHQATLIIEIVLELT
jgi:hypothetical protein